MSDTLQEIRAQIKSLSDAKIERNGSYFYIAKDGKRTGLKAPINEETEKFGTAADLMAYIFRGLQSPRTT